MRRLMIIVGLLAWVLSIFLASALLPVDAPLLAH